MASVGQKSRNPVQEPDKEPLAKGGHLSKRPFVNTLSKCKLGIDIAGPAGIAKSNDSDTPDIQIGLLSPTPIIYVGLQ